MGAIKQVLCSPSFWIIAIYMILPIDVIEDSIPVAGVVDDLIVVFACLAASKMAGGGNNVSNNNNY